MRRAIVADSSLIVSALVGTGKDGAWSESVLLSNYLYAPDIVLVESANIIRRLFLSGKISKDHASLCHLDLVNLPVATVGYELLHERVWQLRDNLTCYDACYVALAEQLDADFYTLDIALSKAPGINCEIYIPPE